MEQYKKSHKKVGKRSYEKLYKSWIKNIKKREDNSRLGVAIWALVIFSVVMAVSFLLVLYGNQYLVK